MKLEDQVVSLELAKRLKELGVKQDGYWHYASALDGTYGLIEGFGEISAFTVAELGEMLPEGYGDGVIMYSKEDGEWNCYFNQQWAYEQDTFDDLSDDKSEADARAKLLIHLIEEKIIKTDES